MILPGGENQDGTGVQFETGTDGSHGDGLNGICWTGSQVAQFVEDADVWDGNLCQETGLVHHGDGLLGVVPLGGLTGQHDTVGSVENGVGDIGDFGTGRTRVVGHGLQHLGGTDDGLALDVALGDHHLLGDEDFRSRDLDSQVTASDHDGIGLFENLVEVVDTLLVFDLGDDLDLLALFAEDVADVLDVAPSSDKRGEHHVYIVLDTKLQIVDILLRERGEVDVGSGKVDALLGGDGSVVETFDAESLVVDDLEDLEGHDTIIDEDEFSNSDHLGDVLVIQITGRMLATVYT